jgi:hypothetical protein
MERISMREARLAAWANQCRRLIWFNLASGLWPEQVFDAARRSAQVENTFLYAFDYEDIVSLPSLPNVYGIINADDADIERLHPSEGDGASTRNPLYRTFCRA